MAVKIAIFNHKGGVGKTTTLYNLGAKLAQKGKTVLMIDADTQCNLTLQVLGEKGYEEHYEQNPKNNIKSYLSPAFDSQPILISAGECINAQQNSLFVMPGSLDLSGYDTQLGMSFNLSSLLTSMRNLPGSFDFLLQKTAEKYSADFILIDLNPSLSAINQNLLISSDYFIIPTSTDYFSIQAIRSLATKIPEWERWAKKARELFSNTNDSVVYPLPQNTPKFLGFTCNKFNLAMTAQGTKPQKNHQQMMDRIGQVVDKIFVPHLKNAGMLINDELYYQNNSQTRDTQSKYCLAEFSDYNKLNVISQQQNIPLYEVPDSKLSDTQKKTRNWFANLYDYVAEETIKRTAYESGN